MEEQEYFSTSETAKLLKITPKTLRVWDKDDIFKPDQVKDSVRRYSKKQIEQKTGLAIYALQNPIMSLTDPAKLEDMMCIAEENNWHCNFNTLLGHTIREKYDSIYCELVKLGTHLYRKNQHMPPNFIFCSPEIGSLFECCCAGYAPSPNWDLEGDKIIYAGTVNNRWRIYHSFLMDKDMALMGYMEKGKIYDTEDYLGLMKIHNFCM